jgi:hypothetical protein
MILTASQIADMAVRVHTANAKWWVNIDTGRPLERNVGELLMLCVSELSEGLEGDRKNLMDDKLPHRTMLEVELADALIRTLDIIGGLRLLIEDVKPLDGVWPSNVGESLLMLTMVYVNAMRGYLRFAPATLDTSMCRAIERLVSFADHLGLDIMGAYEDKMAYNAVRADHQIEARKAADGKKY